MRRFAVPTFVTMLLVAVTASAGASSGKSGWFIQDAPYPHGGARLNDVACVNDSSCVAVGEAFMRSKVTSIAPFAESWDGSSWTIQPTPRHAVAFMSGLTALACSGPEACLAVGYTSPTNHGPWQPLALRWEGSSWWNLEIPMPAGAKDVDLSDVSCPAADSCIVVGEARDANNAGSALAMRWDGSTWSELGVMPPVPSYGSHLAGISCTTPDDCFAVGGYEHAPAPGDHRWWSDVRPLAERWDGSTWSIVRTQLPVGTILDQLSSVSCSAPDSCMAVGVSQPGSGKFEMLVERWDGATWTLRSVSPAIAKGALLSDVSCVGGRCVAVGEFVTARRHAVLRWDGTSWQIEPAPRGGSSDSFSGVSCTGLATCTAVGSFGFQRGSGVLAERTSG